MKSDEKLLQRIMGRITGRAGYEGVAIFVQPSGEVKTSAVHSEVYAAMIRLHPERLLGIYDWDVEDSDVRDDLAWAAEHMGARL